MYRLNNSLQQPPPLSQQTQQQQQQQQQQQSVTQQSAIVATTSTTTQSQQQVIPSHILLQQQLSAAAAAASLGVSLVSHTTTLPQQQQHSHSQHHQLQPINAHQKIINTGGITVVASSVEEKLKLLSSIKAEPMHEYVALATMSSNSNSNSNNNINKNSSSSSNNNNNTNNNNNLHITSNNLTTINAKKNKNIASGNIIALAVNASGSNATATTIPTISSGTLINLANNSTSTTTATVLNTTAPLKCSSTSASSATLSHSLSNPSTINLVINAGGSNTTASTSTSTENSNNNPSSSNGHLVFVPSKRRLEPAPATDDWISNSSPGSVPSGAPPLSPSPGLQSHSANISNGYASPMSAGSYDPYSPNGRTGRDDLSPSSSLNGYSANEGCDAKKSKKGPAPRLQEELCLVCGDRASGYHYNALTCEGCKGFFRRSVTKNAVYCCKFGRACEMDMYMRRKCQECRLKKCLAVGMRPECVVPENQCAMKRREKKAQKEKDKQQNSPSSALSPSDFIKKEVLELMKCEPPTNSSFPLLPEGILAKCQERSIPPLTYNQIAVIQKLIWYQDGYEQPSEEDLKRIMSAPEENESQHDVSFRHITEITILTVQLIVEFAKGLPAFTKIPQEDQITLLKACSSEVMMLRMARRYDHNSDSIFFANNRSYTRDSYKMAGTADNIEDLLHFCRSMYSMKVDNVEYALLTAIVIFSDRPGLEEAELVEAIQSYYIDTLRIYILNRHCGDPMSLVFFAKLLSILTELRTLGNQNAEMCFSLKLKNRKLPKFLEEIWDVHAIPPSVQSHIQATQAEKAAVEVASTSTVLTTTLSAASSTSGGIDGGSVDSGGGGCVGSTTEIVAYAPSTSTGLNGGGGIGGVIGGSIGGGVGYDSGATNMELMGVGVGVGVVTSMKQEHLLGVIPTLKQEHLLGGDTAA